MPGLVETDGAIASATSGRRVFVAIRSVVDDRIYTNLYERASDEWRGWRPADGGFTTEVAPALAFARGQLHLIASHSADGSIHANRFDPSSGAWGGWSAVPGGFTTSHPVAAAVFRGRVYVAAHLDGFDGVSVNQLQLSSGEWSGWTEVPGGEPTDAAPALTGFRGRLYLFTKGAGDRWLYLSVSDRKGRSWSEAEPVPGGGTTDRAATAVRKGRSLALFAKGINDRRLYLNLFDSRADQWSGWQPVSADFTTGSAPNAGVSRGRYFLFAPGFDDDRPYMNVGVVQKAPQPSPSPSGTPGTGATPRPPVDGSTPTPAPSPSSAPQPSPAPTSAPARPVVSGEIRCIVPDGSGEVDEGLGELNWALVDRDGRTLIEGTTGHDGGFEKPVSSLPEAVTLRVRYEGPIVSEVPGSIIPAETFLKVTWDHDAPRTDEQTRTVEIEGSRFVLGTAVFRTVDCELWRIGRMVVRDYHDVRGAPPPNRQLHVMRTAAPRYIPPGWANYDHIPVRPDYLTQIGNFHTEKRSERERILFHEFGHLVAFTADGNRAHWDGDVIGYWYGRNHPGPSEVTNVQYAFMEGWGGYWQQARYFDRRPRAESLGFEFVHWNEYLVANRLMELSALVQVVKNVGPDAADGEMVRVLEANPGRIHSLHEFEVKLHEHLVLDPPTAQPACPPGFTDDGATCRRGGVIVKPSYGRGVGTVLDSCPAGQERSGLLCYPVCQQGYSGSGPDCWGSCPAGYRDDGATCFRDAHIFPKDSFQLGWGAPLPCDGDEERSGLLCYPRCPAGYRREAHICWQQSCPAGYHDDGLSCRRDPHAVSKPRYGRGAGSAMTCGTGREQSHGLCYAPCQPGYSGDGPTCWGRCPAGYDDHGGTCYRHTVVITK